MPSRQKWTDEGRPCRECRKRAADQTVYIERGVALCTVCANAEERRVSPAEKAERAAGKPLVVTDEDYRMFGVAAPGHGVFPVITFTPLPRA